MTTLRKLSFDAVVIGGGAVLDTVGFAAATFHRGIRLVRVPSTTLSQADSGVGVKNGINRSGVKNLLGAFAVPHAVINDRSLLDSLSDDVFRDGFSEAVKVAAIQDSDFFEQLDWNDDGVVSFQEFVDWFLVTWPLAGEE